MKKLLLLLILLSASIYLGLYINTDPGYVSLSIKGWTIEMRLWVAITLLVLSYLVLSLFFRTLSWFTSLGDRFGLWMARRKLKRARQLTHKGLIELTEGDWQTAEKNLLEGVDDIDEPLLNYLAAARAAQEQGAYERRDAYLDKAQQKMPNAKLAVELTQAQLYISNGQIEQALAALKHLQVLDPKHPYVLKLLQKIYVQLSDWRSLQKLLPMLQKTKALNEKDFQKLQVDVYQGLLNDAVKNKDYESLQSVWLTIPRKLQKQTSVIEHYTYHLIAVGAELEAEAILRYQLKSEWNNNLVEIYGLTKASNTSKQLSMAESWLKKHPSNASLYLCLGRLCMMNQLWGKARTYLEKCLAIEPSQAAYSELGTLLEKLGEFNLAAQNYKQGLLVASA